MSLNDTHHRHQRRRDWALALQFAQTARNCCITGHRKHNGTTYCSKAKNQTKTFSWLNTSILSEHGHPWVKFIKGFCQFIFCLNWFLCSSFFFLKKFRCFCVIILILFLLKNHKSTLWNRHYKKINVLQQFAAPSILFKFYRTKEK